MPFIIHPFILCYVLANFEVCLGDAGRKPVINKDLKILGVRTQGHSSEEKTLLIVRTRRYVAIKRRNQAV
jgi:hypothetical protein